MMQYLAARLGLAPRVSAGDALPEQNTLHKPVLSRDPAGHDSICIREATKGDADPVQWHVGPSGWCRVFAAVSHALSSPGVRPREATDQQRASRVHNACKTKYLVERGYLLGGKYGLAAGWQGRLNSRINWEIAAALGYGPNDTYFARNLLDTLHETCPQAPHEPCAGLRRRNA